MGCNCGGSTWQPTTIGADGKAVQNPPPAASSYYWTGAPAATPEPAAQPVVVEPKA